MRVLIFGSRNIDYSIELIESIVKFHNIKIDTIIERDRPDYDNIGRQYGLAHNIRFITVRTHSNIHGLHAVQIRNSEIVDIADIGICLYNGKLKGTLKLINKMQSVGKSVIIHRVETVSL